MVKDILNAIPVLVISLVATVTGGTALGKVIDEVRPTLAKADQELQEAKTMPQSPIPTLVIPGDTVVLPSQGPSQNSSIAVNTAATSSTRQTTQAAVVSAGSFTLASLALHNKAGNCYIAYKGIVYNVSNHPSWSTCNHHGTRGGRDITSIFPHSTTYFSTLPKVGTIKTTTSTGSSNSGSSRSSTDDNSEHEEQEDELEFEEENELEVEIEHD